MNLRGVGEKKSRTRPLRIGYITESYVMGGVERFTSSLINHLDKDEYEVVLICRELSAIDPLVEDVRERCQVIFRSELLDEKHGISSIVRIFKMRKVIKELHLDLLHGQILGGDGGRWILFAARLAGVPVVLTIHGELQETYSRMKCVAVSIMDRLCARYTCVSNYSRDRLVKYSGRMPDKICVIYNGIDISNYDPSIDIEEARALLSVSQSGPIIGIIGRLSPEKHIETFLDAAMIINQKFPKSSFLVIGDGEERNKLEEKARQAGQSYVIFTGYRKDVANCIASLDIFCLSSIHESFGMVIAEAMCMEKPIVATRVGGVPEVVDDGNTGILVDVNDVDGFAEAIMTYLSNPEMARKHGIAGRTRVAEQFSLDRMLRETEILYHQIVRIKSAMHGKVSEAKT